MLEKHKVCAEYYNPLFSYSCLPPKVGNNSFVHVQYVSKNFRVIEVLELFYLVTGPVQHGDLSRKRE